MYMIIWHVYCQWYKPMFYDNHHCYTVYVHVHACNLARHHPFNTSISLSLSLSLSFSLSFSLPLPYRLLSSNRTLLPLLDRWGLQCRSIPLETFYNPTFSEEGEELEETHRAAEERVIIEGLSENKIVNDHTIHMWEITRLHRT